MNDTQERRNFFRIDDEAIIRLQKTSIENYNNAEQILKDNALSSFLLGSSFAALELDYQTVINKVKRSMPDVNLYLELINKKIDLISQHLLNADPIMDKPASPINLSASGISIITADDYQIDDLVEIKLVLLPKRLGIMAFGRVARIENQDEGTFISIDFEHIKESDQELIVKHTLNKQLQEARKHPHQTLE